jgi:hypothetical protein
MSRISFITGDLLTSEFFENNFPIIDIVRFEVNVL